MPCPHSPPPAAARECIPPPRPGSLAPVATLVYDGVVPGWAERLSPKNSFHSWWWLREGVVEVRWSGRRITLGAGDWIFFPSDFARSHRFRPGTRLVSVSFDLVGPDGRAVLDLPEPLRGHGDAALLRRGTALARATHDPGSSPQYPPADRHLTLVDHLRVGALLHELAAELAARALAGGATLRTRAPADPRLAAVLADLAAAPRAGPLPYARWTHLCGLGRVQLDRLSRLHLGVSLRAHRDRLLERELRRHLAGARSSIKEIAAELGFADAAHFNHWVRRRLGAPPSRLRQDIA